VEGKCGQPSRGKAGKGFADGRCTTKDLPGLVDEVQLFAATLAGNARKTELQTWILEGEQLKSPCRISPVDPPGEGPSEASVTVVDHDRLTILHLLLPV